MNVNMVALLYILSLSFEFLYLFSDNEVADEQENSVPPAPPMPLPSRWHLVCQTTEDWENLAMKFKGSRTKCERELYKTLIEDFVPEIPKMIEAKVRFHCCLWVSLVSYLLVFNKHVNGLSGLKTTFFSYDTPVKLQHSIV